MDETGLIFYIWKLLAIILPFIVKHIEHNMKLKERLFHAVLFEIGAILVASFAMLAADMGEAHAAFGVSVAMAFVAMLWNFIFNWGFDKTFTGKREDRSVLLRIFHTVTFEAGLLIATIPMIAYALNLTFWQALVTDIALTVLITVYGFLFNLAYDHARLKFVSQAG